MNGLKERMILDVSALAFFRSVYKTQKEQLPKSYVVGYDITKSKAHCFTPNANKSEFNCSKPFLCKGMDGGNPAARNLGTLVPIDQSVHRYCLDVDCFLDHQIRGVSGV